MPKDQPQQQHPTARYQPYNSQHRYYLRPRPASAHPHNRQQSSQPQPSQPSGNSKPTRSRRRAHASITQAAISRGMRHCYTQLHSQYGGYHSKVVEQVAKKTVLERDRPSQFITHLNSTLKEWFRSLEEGSETEIQAAIYDSRCLLIASNKDATVERIYGEVVKKAVDTFLKDAASTAAERARKSNAKAAFRTERHALKLGQELTGKRPVGLPLIDKLKAEGGEICASFDVTRGFDHHIDDFAKILNGRDDRRSVVFLTSSGKEMHAEQKILLGLSKAAAPRKVDDPSSEIDRSSDVTVAGTFRPCRGCFESLSVVQHCCFNNLQFGSRPGHYWRTTEKGHVEILESLKAGGYLTEQQFQEDFDKNGLLIGLTNTTNRPSLLQPDGSEIKAFNYATDSDSDYEPSEAGSDYEMSEAGSGGGSSEAG